MAFLSQSKQRSMRLLQGWQGLRARGKRWGVGGREIFGALGPGFLVSAGEHA